MQACLASEGNWVLVHHRGAVASIKIAEENLTQIVCVAICIAGDRYLSTDIRVQD